MLKNHLIIFFMTSFMMAFTGYAKDGGKVLLADRALFRVDKTVFFQSDIKDLVAAFQLLLCVRPKSILLTGLELNSLEQINAMSKLVDKQEFQQLQQNKTFRSIIKLVKLHHFVAQRSNFNFAQSLKKSPKPECIKKGWKSWPPRPTARSCGRTPPRDPGCRCRCPVARSPKRS